MAPRDADKWRKNVVKATPNVDKVDNKRTTKKVAKETTIVLIIFK